MVSSSRKKSAQKVGRATTETLEKYYDGKSCPMWFKIREYLPLEGKVSDSRLL